MNHLSNSDQLIVAVSKGRILKDALPLLMMSQKLNVQRPKQFYMSIMANV